MLSSITDAHNPAFSHHVYSYDMGCLTVGRLISLSSELNKLHWSAGLVAGYGRQSIPMLNG